MYCKPIWFSNRKEWLLVILLLLLGKGVVTRRGPGFLNDNTASICVAIPGWKVPISAQINNKQIKCTSKRTAAVQHFQMYPARPPDSRIDSRALRVPDRPSSGPSLYSG